MYNTLPLTTEHVQYVEEPSQSPFAGPFTPAVRAAWFDLLSCESRLPVSIGQTAVLTLDRWHGKCQRRRSRTHDGWNCPELLGSRPPSGITRSVA